MSEQIGGLSVRASARARVRRHLRWAVGSIDGIMDGRWAPWVLQKVSVWAGPMRARGVSFTLPAPAFQGGKHEIPHCMHYNNNVCMRPCMNVCIYACIYVSLHKCIHVPMEFSSIVSVYECIDVSMKEGMKTAMQDEAVYP